MQNIHLLFITFTLLVTVSCLSQEPVKIGVSETDQHNLYNFELDDATELFYLEFVPKNKPKACLVILPGAGELVEDVIAQISLHKLAIDNDILVVFPSINWGTIKFIEEFKFLDAIFKQIIERHNIAKDQFILGGLSAGGMISLRYAERANENPQKTFLKPKAVFAIDSPLDFTHLYEQSERDIQRSFSEAAVNESIWLLDKYNTEFGGSPKEKPSEYIKHSIFSQSEKDGGNAKYLLNTPVKVYTEPALAWQMKNKQRDVYDLNCADISAMINLLQLGGNKHAEMIVTHDKGVRLDGTKHPHSWSIMDSNDMLKWILKHVE